MTKTTMVDNNILNLIPFIEIENKEKTFNEIKNKVKNDIKQKIINDYNYSNKYFKINKLFIKIFNFSILSIIFLFIFPLFYRFYLYKYLGLTQDIFSILGGLTGSIFLFIILGFAFYQNSKESIEKNKKLKFFLEDEDENKINYLMPLSSKEISIICYNNDVLKEHLINNNYNYISMQLIDNISNKSTDDNLLGYNYKKSNNYGEVIISNIYSKIEKDNVFKIIKKEQGKFKNINIVNTINFKVTYKIKNGPIKNIVFKHSHKDIYAFKNYIKNVVENDYNREFDILKIDLA